MRRQILTQSMSNKIAASIDIAATLLIEHFGTTYKLPFYHPYVVVPVLGITYALFKWKHPISEFVLESVTALHYNVEKSKRVLTYIPDIFTTTTGAIVKQTAVIDSLKEEVRKKSVISKATKNRNWYNYN
ncbi:MAG TPA: hypothetical protein VJH90_04070 [archaeon]|nr:hypothetical protein [archaeon]